MDKIRKKIGPIIIAVVILVVCLLGRNLFVGFNNLLGDLLIESKGVGEQIVIVAIDDASIAKLGQWPWPRGTYADLIKRLAKTPPLILGIDVLFSEPSRVGASDDKLLASALGEAKFPIVLASRTLDGVTPLASFVVGQVRMADVSLVVDPDGIVRRVPSNINFASELAGKNGVGSIDGRVVWSGKPGSFRRIPLYRLLEDDELVLSLAGKILILGSTATDLHDEQLTAIDRGRAMPGVEIEANLTNMYLSGYAYREVGGFAFFLLLLIITMLPAVCFILFSGMNRPLITSLGVLVIVIISTILFWQREVALPILLPFLAWFLSTIAQLLYRYFAVERSRKELRTLFGKYVSAPVLEEILRDPKAVKLGGEEYVATILFSDVRGFTTFSESMTPTELVTFLNRYLSNMTEIIIREGGVIDKYIGDAIMAFWGAPISNKNNAKDALLAATHMSDALDIFNEENRKLGIQEINIGIGLHTGAVVAGNMGSEHRFDYTVMGDTVNLSSRLESLTKAYGVQILASEDTLVAVGPMELKRLGINFREVDCVLVKGKHKPVRIFEIYPEARSGEYNKVAGVFSTALEYYYKGGGEKRLQMLADIEGITPNDGPSRILRERCLQFKVVPPADWNG